MNRQVTKDAKGILKTLVLLGDLAVGSGVVFKNGFAEAGGSL